MKSFRWQKASADAATSILIRTATPRDAERFGEYFGTLSQPSRCHRFMGEVSNLSKVAFDCLVHGCKADRFTLVAELSERGRDAIIGEASYAFDRETKCGEFAISVGDRWQRQGVGAALLCALQLRAISLGCRELFGETLKTNHEMKSFARRAGFEFTRSLDWRAVRFDKRLSGQPVQARA